MKRRNLNCNTHVISLCFSVKKIYMVLENVYIMQSLATAGETCRLRTSTKRPVDLLKNIK
jgi:hypothetical protein